MKTTGKVKKPKRTRTWYLRDGEFVEYTPEELNHAIAKVGRRLEVMRLEEAHWDGHGDGQNPQDQFCPTCVCMYAEAAMDQRRGECLRYYDEKMAAKHGRRRTAGRAKCR